MEQDVQVCWDDNHTERFMQGVKYTNADHDEMDASRLGFVQLISPTNEGEDPTLWTEDGGCFISLTVMPEEKPEPKETFIIDVTTLLGQTFSIEADSLEDAKRKANELVNNREFFEEHLHAKWLYDNEWNGAVVDQVVDGYDCHGDDGFIAPEVVDSYLEEE